MKGPSERLKYELRRVWECPACQRRERAPGSVTSKLCMCQMKHADGKPVVMKLVVDDVQRVSPPIVVRHSPAEPVAIAAAIVEIPPPAEPIQTVAAIDDAALEAPPQISGEIANGN